MYPHALSVAKVAQALARSSPIISAQQDMPGTCLPAQGLEAEAVQANPNIGEAVRGRTPLHDALARGAGLGIRVTGEVAYKDVLAALLRWGGSVRARDCRGDTPLGYALDGNNAGALAALLANEKLRRPWRTELSRELRRLFKRYIDGALWRRYVRVY